MTDVNTRQEKRTPVTLKIKFKSDTLAQFIERYSVDISTGGIFVRTKQPLAIGTPLRFEFQLKDSSPLISGEGTVVWTRDRNSARPGVAPGMGVRFDRLNPKSREVLDEILAKKSSQTKADGGFDDDENTKVAPKRVLRKLTASAKIPISRGGGTSAFGGGGFGESFEEATKVTDRADLGQLVAATARPMDEDEGEGEGDKETEKAKANQEEKADAGGAARAAVASVASGSSPGRAVSEDDDGLDDLPTTALGASTRDDEPAEAATDVGSASESRSDTLSSNEPAGDGETEDAESADDGDAEPRGALDDGSDAAEDDEADEDHPAAGGGNPALWAVIGVILLIAAGGTGYMLLGQRGEGAATAAAEPDTLARTGASPAPSPSSGRAVPAPREAAEPIPEPEALNAGDGDAATAPADEDALPRRVVVTTEPPGAHITINEQEIDGQTPFTVTLDPDLAAAEVLTIHLTKPGFAPADRQVPTEGAFTPKEDALVLEIDATLEPQEAPRRVRRARRHRPPRAHATKPAPDDESSTDVEPVDGETAGDTGTAPTGDAADAPPTPAPDDAAKAKQPGGQHPESKQAESKQAESKQAESKQAESKQADRKKPADEAKDAPRPAEKPAPESAEPAGTP